MRFGLGGSKTARQSAGFTLVELLVVLVILGLLVTFAAPPVLRHLGKAKSDTSKIQIQNLVATLDLYRLDVGQYPDQTQGLSALVSRPSTPSGWNGPYLRKADSLIDPWGVPYAYRIPGEHGEFDLFTLGADKSAGGTGENLDVANW